MPKTSAKRKSEGALPSGRNKQRKASEYGSESAHAGNESESMFVSDGPAAPKYIKSKPKARKSEPISSKKDDDEYEEDEGRTESQRFLEIVADLKRKKERSKAGSEYIKKVDKMVQKEEQALKDRRDELVAASEKLDSNFLASFKICYTLSRPAQPQKQSIKGKEKDLSPAGCFALRYQQSKKLTSDANRIIETFENANEKTIAIISPGLLKINWSQENDMAEQVLAIGHQVGLQKFQAMLKGDEAMPVVEEDDEMFVAAIYGEQQPQEENTRVTWGRSVKTHLKYTKKIWKMLPPPAPPAPVAV